jgi:hypothetical protein
MKKIFMGFILFGAIVSCVEDSNVLYDRDAWLGQWTCNEVEGDYAPQSYNVDIVERIGEGNIALRGLYNEGYDMVLEGKIVGQTIEIPEQTVNDITFFGDGTMNDDLDEITLFFSEYDFSV